jgi:hypothetical protein
VRKLSALLIAIAFIAPAGLLVRRALAEVITNVRVPVAVTLPSPCTGELVSLEGVMHTVTRSTMSDSGNVLVGLSIDTCGVSGTSLSGAKFVSNETIEETAVVHPDGPTVQTMTTNHEFIRSGSALANDDLKLHITWHVTLQDDGVASATIAKLEIECR